MKILLLSLHHSNFVMRDYEILKKHFDVTFIDYNKKVRPSFQELISLIKTHDVLYFWFASIHFIFPVLAALYLRKKIVTIAGGYDVADLPELKYGSAYSFWKRNIVKWILNSSDYILPVSSSNLSETVNNFGKLKGKTKLVYHGFERSGEPDLDKKENRVVTIGFISDESFLRKGIDRFIEAAKNLPDIPFHIIGRNEIRLDAPPNVIIEGYLNKEEFNDLLKKSKLYLQFSRHEAFGCSVADAMQMGCIPVVSNSFSLPEVVGNCGIVIDDFKDYKAVSAVIRKALDDYTISGGLAAADRVNKVFPIESREVSLKNIISSLKKD